MKGLLEKFNREDLPNESLRLLSDVIGVNQVKLIMVKCPGMIFSVPKSFYAQSDMNYIEKHKYDSPELIAHNIGSSVRTVYRKLQKIRAKEPV